MKVRALGKARFIGIDIGTTSVKAARVDETGQITATYSQPYPTTRKAGGIVEQDPKDWTRLVRDALSQMDPEGVVAVGLTSQVNTHVFTDTSGQALLPAIIWQDGRSQDEAAKLDAKIDVADKLRWWGAPMPIDASHACSRMIWVARHHPDVWTQTRWVLLPKDFVAFQLTGIAATDALSSIGLVDQNLSYVTELLDHVQGAHERLAPITAVTDPVGVIKEGPMSGVPLICGTMDAWAGLVGAGGAREGSSIYLSGTSEILGISSQTVVPTPGAIVFSDYEGVRLHAAPTQSGGDAKMWFANSFDMSLDEMTDLVARTSGGPATPLFLPQLQGERAPLWDVDLRAAFLGVSRTTSNGDFARAVYEGVAMAARLALETLQASAGQHSEIILCGGGGFRSDPWNQIRADFLNAELRVLASGEPGVLGAAMLAAVGAGHYQSIAEAVGALATYDRVYTPAPETRSRTDALYGLYREAIQANADMGKRLAAANAC